MRPPHAGVQGEPALGVPIAAVLRIAATRASATCASLMRFRRRTGSWRAWRTTADTASGLVSTVRICSTTACSAVTAGTRHRLWPEAPKRLLVPQTQYR